MPNRYTEICFDKSHLVNIPVELNLGILRDHRYNMQFIERYIGFTKVSFSGAVSFILNFFQNFMRTKNFIVFPILHDSLNGISYVYYFRRIAFVHETGLAIVYGLIMGAIIRFGVQEEKEVISKLLFKLYHKKTSKIDNSTYNH